METGTGSASAQDNVLNVAIVDSPGGLLYEKHLSISVFYAEIQIPSDTIPIF